VYSTSTVSRIRLPLEIVRIEHSKLPTPVTFPLSALRSTASTIRFTLGSVPTTVTCTSPVAFLLGGSPGTDPK
jgi:hypothetical protein